MRKQKMVKCKFVILMLEVLLFTGGLARATTWTTIPISGYGMDIDGDNIVAGNQLYNIHTQSITTFDTPAEDMSIYGIDGDNMVGSYISTVAGDSGVRGFFHDGQTYTTIHKTDVSRIFLNDIEGNYIVGTVDAQGFIYDLTDNSWTAISKPDAYATSANGISGNNVVGKYYDGSQSRSFLYNVFTKTWTDLSNLPGDIHGFSGNNIVGLYQGDSQWHGFIYDITTHDWMTLDIPAATSTIIYGIDGNNIVGEYWDTSGLKHGFLYTIPEPTSILIFSFCALILSRKHTA